MRRISLKCMVGRVSPLECIYRVIPYVTVTIFAAFFGFVLPVNYLLLVRDQLLFACL